MRISIALALSRKEEPPHISAEITRGNRRGKIEFQRRIRLRLLEDTSLASIHFLLQRYFLARSFSPISFESKSFAGLLS